MKGDGRYPEYPSVGVDDDVGGLVVLMGDGVERPDVAFPHFLGGEVNALHAAVLRLVPLQPIVVPSLRIKEVYRVGRPINRKVLKIRIIWAVPPVCLGSKKLKWRPTSSLNSHLQNLANDRPPCSV